MTDPCAKKGISRVVKGLLPVDRRPFRSGGDGGGPVHTLHTG